VNVRKIYWISLVISCLGFAVSLLVHVRSLLGFGLADWFVLPAFLLLPLGAWFVAADDVVHGGTARWQKKSLAPGESEVEKQMFWGQSLYCSMSKPFKWGGGFFVFYFLILAVLFLKNSNSTYPFAQSSLRYIEAPLATLLSCICMGKFWMYAATFTRVLKLK
jgi:hypothetical protein